MIGNTLVCEDYLYLESRYRRIAHREDNNVIESSLSIGLTFARQ